MCGIVGYIGKKQAVPFILQGLEKLEYRGYDSSGISVITDGKLKTIKKAGRLCETEKELQNHPDFFNSTIGMGHTRWATHGIPSDGNAHPHISMSGKISVVHNGIIENYISIKDDLIQKGFKFKSETDTEVIANLLESLYTDDIFKAVLKAVKIMEGAFALSIISENDPDVLIGIKKESPLILGIGENENYIASDVPAVLEKTRKVCRLGECQIAVLKSNDFKIYDFNGNPVNVSIETIDWNVKAAEKNGYKHFMMKEILEQPDVIKSTISPRITEENEIKLDNLNLSKEFLKNLQKIFIVACGSASHVGYSAKYVIEKIAKIPVEVDLASEFRYRSPIINEKTLIIIISQSGETADSLAALREAKKMGAKVISIVNVIGSAIANESDYVLYTWAGAEIAVATTKAYSAQLAVIYLLALHFGFVLGIISKQELEKFIKALNEIPEKVSYLLSQKEKYLEIAKKYYKRTSVFFIGRTLDYPTCMEGSLKFKEISYIPSEAYAAGELKHGTISLIQDETLVVALATNNKLFDKTVSNIREVKSRGAKVLAITTENKFEKISKVADDVILIPETCEEFKPSLAVIPLQLFSYYVADLLGCDIDKPRNLAKSVTVE